MLRNHRRGRARYTALAGRLAEALTVNSTTSPLASDVLGAINTLSERDRELVMLTAWEGLTPTEAATVLGLKPTAARVRLHRARARLREMIGEASPRAVSQVATLDAATLAAAIPLPLK